MAARRGVHPRARAAPRHRVGRARVVQRTVSNGADAPRGRAARRWLADVGALRVAPGRAMGRAVGADRGRSAAGSAEEFIAEHYWGYTRQRDGSTIEYRVSHPRWRSAPAGEARLDADVSALYGAPFDALLSGAPQSAFMAEGSAVTVYRPVTLSDASSQHTASR